MFYCDPCATKYGYPETIFKSEGKCETCDKHAVCNDMPSKYLPMPLRPDGTRAPDPFDDPEYMKMIERAERGEPQP